MSRIIHQNRNGCALQGAVKTLAAVEGFVPVIHSNAGCAVSQTPDWRDLPSTNLIEKQIVFGGASRLREQIKNTVKILDGELYVVVTGCSSEMVGDDVPAMIKEAQEQQLPVVGLETAGFRGNVYKGYELSVKKIMENISGSTIGSEVLKGTVNLLGIVPEQDLFWEGSLTQLQRLLGGLGLVSNPLFGAGQGIGAWQRACRAELTLVLSPWGLEAAHYLEERYGIPYLESGGIPVGAEDENRLAAKLAARLGLDERRTAERNRQALRLQTRCLGRLAPLYYSRGLQKEAAIVGPSAFAAGYARFLAECFGQIILAVIVTDNPPEGLREAITQSVTGQGLEGGGAYGGTRFLPRVYYSEDTSEIRHILEETRPEIILGSVLEKPAAAGLEVPLLIAAGHQEGFVVLNKSYTGTDGAMALAEDYANALLSHHVAHAGD